jgi:hypothetical protein
MIPVFDQLNKADNSTTQTAGLHQHEVAEFRSWRDDLIRQEAINSAQAKVSAENVAAEAAADSAALRLLELRGVTMKDCFGASSTLRGRNVAQILTSTDS